MKVLYYYYYYYYDYYYWGEVNEGSGCRIAGVCMVAFRSEELQRSGYFRVSGNQNPQLLPVHPYTPKHYSLNRLNPKPNFCWE